MGGDLLCFRQSVGQCGSRHWRHHFLQGRRLTRLSMQVLGTGDLKVKVTVAATQFSESARKKIEEAGGSIVDVPAKIKWTRAIGKERKAAAAAKA